MWKKKLTATDRNRRASLQQLALSLQANPEEVAELIEIEREYPSTSAEELIETMTNLIQSKIALINQKEN